MAIKVFESVGNGSVDHGFFDTTDDAEEFIMSRVVYDLNEELRKSEFDEELDYEDFDTDLYSSLIQERVSYYSIDIED